MSSQYKGQSFSCLIDYDDNFSNCTMIDDGSYNNLSVNFFTVDASSLVTEFVAVESDQNTNLSLIKEDNNDLILVVYTSRQPYCL